MNDLSDISALLREAKPLYLKRKRRRTIGQRTVAGLAVLGLALGMVPHPKASDLTGFYTELYASSYKNETETVPDWIPTDEFGLIVVD